MIDVVVKVTRSIDSSIFRWERIALIRNDYWCAVISLPLVFLFAQTAVAQKGDEVGDITAVSSVDPTHVEVRVKRAAKLIAGETLSVFRPGQEAFEQRYRGVLVVQTVRDREMIGICLGFMPEGGEEVWDTPIVDIYGRPLGQYFDFKSKAAELTAVLEALKDDRIGRQFALRERLEAERLLQGHAAGEQKREADRLLAELGGKLDKATAATKKAQANEQLAKENALRFQKEVDKLSKSLETTKMQLQETVREISQKEERIKELEERDTNAKNARNIWTKWSPGQKAEWIVRFVSGDTNRFPEDESPPNRGRR